MRGGDDLTFWRGRVLVAGLRPGRGHGDELELPAVATVRGGNGLQADLHDFQIAPNDVAYITAYNPIHCDLSSAGGTPQRTSIIDAVVQEIDMRDRAGALGVAQPRPRQRRSESETSPPTSTPWDWFHLNSIDPEPDGNVLISARSTWAAYQLQGGTGRILWRLGGLDELVQDGAGHENRVAARRPHAAQR